MLPRAIRLLACAIAAILPAAAQDAAGLDFFEKNIRPLLSQRCYSCHSSKTVASSGLRLDTKQAIQRGGHRGPALIANDPAGSLLFRAVSYSDPDLRMPPQGKLNETEISLLEQWIALGAPDPREETVSAPAASASLERRRRHWAFQPFRKYPSPPVRNPAWPKTWIDNFILATLESKNLQPAPSADKRTLLRRVTFDLTGLPPTPRELADFLADTSPTAYEKVVDRLLASPHYGERWARHWLDLARYAETNGHEFDFEKPNAWRYRDYIIRALNDDLPFNEFIRHQIAGDLLPTRQMAASGLYWDSPAATALYGLGEERNAADDLAEVRSEKIANQLDTIGKTFLGLAIACAKCHDHKFDPISTRDYYALAGILNSTQVIQASLDPPSRLREFDQLAAELEALQPKLQASPAPAAYLRSAVDHYKRDAVPGNVSPLDPALLKLWIEELKAAATEPDHVLYPAAAFAKEADPAKVVATLREWTEKADPAHPIHKERGDHVLADFRKGAYGGFRAEGPAFAPAPSAGLASSYRSAVNEFTGFLISKSFPANGRYFHVRLKGASDNPGRRGTQLLRVSLIGDGRDVTVTPDPSGRMKWRTAGMDKMPGELAFLEIVDRSRAGHLAVERIFLSNSKEPPFLDRAPDARLLRLFESSPPESLDSLLSAYESLFQEGLPIPVSTEAPLDEARRAQRQALLAKIPDAQFGFVAAEDEPRNLRLHIGGNHRNLGEEVPRGALSLLPASGDYSTGSGRAQLAEDLVNPANPLTARVLVNRVWKHHFGEGIVRSVDNFGLTGDRPSHPELLDTLAARFIEEGWSLKKLHRTLVLSATYRMSSAASPRATAIDADNRLLQHMPVRRLEAEAIRDAILAVSGSLDRTVYGEPIPPFISDYQDGRGKPPSGPLDGAGRRSIYLGVRRNFLLPMFLAFDYPMTVATVGRRGAATVPSQALTLMNNEFVARQAARWADRAAGEAPSPEARVRLMFETAFARPAEPAEVESSLQFIAAQAKRYPATEDGQFRAWSDLAHVLLNAKEFLFLR